MPVSKGAIMADLPQFLYDLALILLTAGVTMFICKKLNQPLILGYIIAGFLTGPNFTGYFTISSKDTITVWSQIGVIFLLFSLGLEISLPKLQQVGKTAVIAEFFELLVFFLLGYGGATLLGWPQGDRLFFGVLLCMSSTAVVIKTFDDLGLRQKKYTDVVFGLLIMEDMAGVIVMVLISTVAQASGSDASGAWNVLAAILKLGLFVILWMVLGIYLLPTLYKSVKSYLNDEMLLILSVALCLGTVVLCAVLDFSTSLGAFLAGTVLAATLNLKRLPELVRPLQYLFGAIFFVSIGMMVKPGDLFQYRWPILLALVIVYLGKVIGTSTGIFLAGQKLDTALRSGFSLTQVGEFAMIAASTGVAFGVLSDYIYAVIVAVSVLTIFTTPLFMKAASPVCSGVIPRLPTSWRLKMERYSTDVSREEDRDRTWMDFLHYYLFTCGLYGVLCIGICLLAEYVFLPVISVHLANTYGWYVTGILTLLLLAPFLRMLLSSIQNQGTEKAAVLWFRSRYNHLPLLFLLLCKVLLALAFIYYVQRRFLWLGVVPALLVTLALAFLIVRSDWVLASYLHMETQFFVNLNDKYIRQLRQRSGEKIGRALEGFADGIFLQTFTFQKGSPYVGRTLAKVAFRQDFGFNVLRLSREEKVLDFPGAGAVLNAGSSMLCLGTEGQLEAFAVAAESRDLKVQPSGERVSFLNYYRAHKDAEDKDCLLPCVVNVNYGSGLVGKSLKHSELRKNWHSMVIAMERNGYLVPIPDVNLVLLQGDLLWILGQKDMVGKLIRQGIL